MCIRDSASWVQRGFQQLLVKHRGALRLIVLVLLPALPAEYSHQRQYAAGQQRLAVAIPPVLDLRDLFVFGLHV